jgi:hypothetical protein
MFAHDSKANAIMNNPSMEAEWQKQIHLELELDFVSFPSLCILSCGIKAREWFIDKSIQNDVL